MIVPNLDRLMSAHHEAGHAAVHDAFGHPITRVTIDGAGKTEGGRVQSGFLEYCIPLLAGHVAHERFAAAFGLPFPAAAREAENSTDIAKFGRALLDVDEAARADVRRFVWALTEDAVNTVWPKISLLAAMLLAHGTVSGADLPLTAERRFDLTAFTDDAPVNWWRLGDPATITTGADQIGNINLTYVDNPKGGQALVANDPNLSTFFDHPDAGSGNVAEATATTPIPSYPFSLEFVFRSAKQTDSLSRILFSVTGNSGARSVDVLIDASPTAGELAIVITDDSYATGSVFGTTGVRVDDKVIHHVVLSFYASDSVECWIDGVFTALGGSTKTVSLPSGSVQVAIGNVTSNTVQVGEFGADAEIQDVAIYDEILSDATIVAHAAAMRAPWNGDQPEDRADRILDIVGWSDADREMDAGNVSLQSADINGQTALEHLQRIAETEFGLLFASRDGKVRLVSRAAQFARTPKPNVFGDADDGVEIPYRDIKFDDGDSVIRNRATITQLNGVPAVSESTASVDEYGRFDYNLDGLLHDSLTYGSSYADFIVAEYAQPRRRIVGLDLGPMTNAAGWAALMDLELGDAVTIRNRPLPASSTVFEQVSVIEAIEHDWSPKVRTARLTLSPEFTSTGF